MNIRSVDLNLLVVFEAVYRLSSVSRAAEALSMPQPTVSNALRRLRDTFGDPLFVRSGPILLPTPFAQELARPVAEGLAHLDLGLKAQAGFDPATTRRQFTLIMTDIAEAVILPRLLSACRETAPKVSFRTCQMRTDEILEALRSGTVDVAIGFIPKLGGALRQLLFESDYVVLSRVRSGQREEIDRDTFMRRRHAVAEAQGTGHSLVERTLSRLGLEDRIGARVPHFLALPVIVGSSDLLATVPRPLAQVMKAVAPVAIHEHPLPLPRLPIRQFWHERYNADPASRWLRSTLRSAVADLTVLRGAAVRKRATA